MAAPQVMTAKNRYEVGLQKLATTEESVAGMQEELIALQPQLEASTRETEAAMEVIARESAEADKVKQVGVDDRLTAFRALLGHRDLRRVWRLGYATTLCPLNMVSREPPAAGCY
jgi:hypothetical protein